MKYLTFIILAFLLIGMTACSSNEPTEEEISGAMPQDFTYASGSLGYPVSANGVIIEVQQAGLLAGYSDPNPDYVHLMLDMRITNESKSAVIPPTMTLVDDHQNRYVSWQETLPYENQLVRMPNSINPEENATGQLIYILPVAATQDNLRLRWDSESHQARVEIFLGPVGQRAMFNEPEN